MGARKLKNGAGDGANIHVFNIKPCVFPATFLDAILPNCLACLQARHQTPRVPCISIPRISIPYARAVLGHVARGLPGGMVTARIEPCIMSNITVITLNKFGKRARGCCVHVFLVS